MWELLNGESAVVDLGEGTGAGDAAAAANISAGAGTAAIRLHALAVRIGLPRLQAEAFQALLDIWTGAGEAKDALLEELMHNRELLKAVMDAHSGARGRKRPLSAAGASGSGAAQ